MQYIITRKNEYSRKLKEYEKRRQAEESEEHEQANRKHQKNIEQFENNGKPVIKKVEGAVLGINKDGPSTSKNATSISNMENGNAQKLPSFWLPTNCPNAGLAKAQKPDPTIYCPVSEKPLKVKDLIEIKFTLLKDGNSSKSLIAKEARYMCPVTHDVLSNAVPCCVLRPTYVVFYSFFFI